MEQNYAIMFADIAGSTKMYDSLGNAEADRQIRYCVDTLSSLTAKHRGTLIKTIGDEIMASFDEANDAIDAAIEMQNTISGDESSSLAIRVGVQFGQAQGQELGSFADIYSLGVVLYETLTGKVPYDADSSIAVVFKHITEPVPTLEGELAVYQPVLDRMMSKDKAARYQNCDEIVADINSLMSGGDAFNATMINNATAINQAVAAGKRITRTDAATGTKNRRRKS